MAETSDLHSVSMEESSGLPYVWTAETIRLLLRKVWCIERIIPAVIVTLVRMDAAGSVIAGAAAAIMDIVKASDVEISFADGVLGSLFC